MRQSSSVWGPVFVLYCFWIWLATGTDSPGGVGQFFTSRHSGTSCKHLLLRWHIIRARMTYRHCQFMSSRLPGSLKQTRGSGCLSWQPSLLVLMQSRFYNLKTYFYWQKHYDITNSSVQVWLLGGGWGGGGGGGGIIIGKSFDKLAKPRDVNVSTKRWRDGSQTQRYGGSSTGYSDCSQSLPK